MFNDDAVKLLKKVREQVASLADGKEPIKDQGVCAAVEEITQIIQYYQQGPNDLKKEYDLYHN